MVQKIPYLGNCISINFWIFKYCFYYSFTHYYCAIFILRMLDFFNTIWVSNSLDPDQAQHFVEPDLGPNCLQGLSADTKMSGWLWVQTVCKGYQQTTKEDKELNTQKLVDTTFWLKPWLKLISFGYDFFHLAKVLATTNYEPELALIVTN